MLSEAARVFELVLSTLKVAPDQKRVGLAKELLRVYVDLLAIVRNGRELLLILKSERQSGPALEERLRKQETLLVQTMDRLQSSGGIGQVLQLHLPEGYTSLTGDLGLKWAGIRYLFDQLLAARDIKNDAHPPLLTLSLTDASGSSKIIDIYASPTALGEAERQLNSIDQSGQQLRSFLLENFKFEDVL